MKNIFEYLQDSLLNNEMINEAFNASVFHEIQKQFADYNKKENEEHAKNQWHSADHKKFKDIFNGWNIAWDKIKDSDVQECSKDNKKDVQLAKRIVAHRSNHINGMIILYNDDDKAYDGAIISLSGDAYYMSFRSRWGCRSSNVSPSGTESSLTKKFYVIDLTNFETWNLRNDRYQQKQGSYEPGDEYYYKQVAEKNRDRYKQLVAKYRAERDADDGIAEKVDEYTKKVLDFASKISKEPLRYASLEYRIGDLMDLLRDERKWNAGGRGYKSYYSGTNGLLYLYSQYLESKLHMSQGNSYQHQRDTYNECKKAILKACTLIDQKLQALEADIAKQEAKDAA